jgi:hypothetical protein
MSNTVKIKNKKKKNEIKINYKLWAIIFGVFVGVIVIGAVWASFHWGVGFGTIGSDPMTSEEAAAAATEIANSASTDAIVLTPEELEKMGITTDGNVTVEGAGDAAADGAAEDTASGEAGADGAKAEDAESK